MFETIVNFYVIAINTIVDLFAAMADRPVLNGGEFIIAGIVAYVIIALEKRWSNNHPN